MKKLLFLLTSFTPFFLEAQITVIPVFPTVDDNITITYDATQGSRGLINETLDVYAHTGVITDKSTSSSDWKYVKAAWTENRPDCKLTRSATDPNIYTLSFKIKDFYGVPAGETIKQLAIVFRNATSQHEGKTSDNGDIFYTVFSATAPLQTKLVSPTSNSLLVKKGDFIPVNAYASAVANLTLYDNGTIVNSTSNAKQINTTITAVDGVHKVVFKAISATASDSVSFFYSVIVPVTTAELPQNAELGTTFNVAGDSLTFVFQAPSKQNVFVVGSFNDYQVSNNYLMNKTADGKYWWLKIGGLTPTKTYTYQYLVDGTLKIADPLSTLILDPANDAVIPAITFPNLPPYPTGKTTGFVSVVQSNVGAYNWKINNFIRPAKSNLVIYELHIRDFIARHDFQTMIDTIGYLQKLGINAIELMPISEFDNNESWGYNPTFHNALDKYYGTGAKLKEFVDTCHARGIAVILDVVFNHIWGNSSLAALYPLDAHPYLNKVATHPYSVGIDFNHESEYTQNYVLKCIKTWLTDYRVDGFRFDLAKGFTQKVTNNDADFARYDPSRIAIIKKYHQQVQKVTPGAYTILELFSDLQEETELANNGMMMWANLNYNYINASLGNNDNGFDYVTANARSWNTTATSDKLIAYAESHDEERIMYRNLQAGNYNGSYSIRSLNTALTRIELINAFYYTVPGPKMLWQFGELGYDYNIDYNCRVCNKPIRWDYLKDAQRKRLFDVTSSLIDLKKSYPVFQTGTYSSADLVRNTTKAFHLADGDLQVTILGNFYIDDYDVTPNFQRTGKWYNFFKGDSINVINTASPLTLKAGEYRIYSSKPLKKPLSGYSFYTGVNEVESNLQNFSVAPNPAKAGKSVIVEFSLETNAPLRFKITNILGETVYESGVKNYTPSNHSEILNCNLSDGFYFVSAQNTQNNSSFKTIKLNS